MTMDEREEIARIINDGPWLWEQVDEHGALLNSRRAEVLAKADKIIALIRSRPADEEVFDQAGLPSADDVRGILKVAQPHDEEGGSRG